MISGNHGSGIKGSVQRLCLLLSSENLVSEKSQESCLALALYSPPPPTPVSTVRGGFAGLSLYQGGYIIKNISRLPDERDLSIN